MTTESESTTGAVVEREPDVFSDYFCTSCQALVQNPPQHREEEHEDRHRYEIDILSIVEERDGEYIAQADDKGHYTPHIWTEVDGMDMCGECGAVKFTVAE